MWRIVTVVLMLLYRVCGLSNGSDLSNNFSLLKWNYNSLLSFVSHKMTFLGSHTAQKTVLQLLIAVLKFGYCNSLSLVGYSRLNVVTFSKIMSLEMIFQSLEEKNVARDRVGEMRRLRSHRDVFTNQKFVC